MKKFGYTFLPSCPCSSLQESRSNIAQLLTEEEVTSRQQEFNVSFFDRYYYSHSFQAFLEHVTVEGGRGTFYSKSVAIIQHSCGGKSRLVAEVGRRMPLFYICNRGPNDTGFPLSTPDVIKRLAEHPLDKRARVEAFYFCRCVAFFCSISIVAQAVWRTIEEGG